MADRVHPLGASSAPAPPVDHLSSSTSPSPPPDAESETSPLHRSTPSSAAETYIIDVPKDQVFFVPPPDRARKLKVYAARPARRRFLHKFCCCSFAIVLLLVLLAGAAFGIIYLTFRPRLPSFSLAALSATGLTNTTLASPAPLSPTMKANFTADNTRNNVISFQYPPGGSLSVAFRGTALCTGPWPSFDQPANNATLVSTSLAPASAAGVSLGATDRRALSGSQTNGSVPLAMTLRMPVKPKLWFITMWAVTVTASCDVKVTALDTVAEIRSGSCSVDANFFGWKP